MGNKETSSQSEDIVNNLRPAWTTLMKELAPNADDVAVKAIFEDLVTRYSEPTRHYHTLCHVSEMLNYAEQYQASIKNKNIVLTSIWFHDAIYDSTANDNEEQSAEFARNSLTTLGVANDVMDKVAQYTLDTKSHIPSDVQDEDLALFLDFDMAILAADPLRYDEYAKGIEEEYSWAKNVNGQDLYTSGRLSFLQSAITKPEIFYSKELKPIEPQARSNMQREATLLASLGNNP